MCMQVKVDISIFKIYVFLYILEGSIIGHCPNHAHSTYYNRNMSTKFEKKYNDKLEQNEFEIKILKAKRN